MSVFTELLFTQGYVTRLEHSLAAVPHPNPLPGGEGDCAASRAAAASSGSLEDCGDPSLRSAQPC